MPGCWVDNAIRYRGVKSELITNMLLNTDHNMLVPMPVSGTREQIPCYLEYEWIQSLPNKSIYFALFQRDPAPLPQGYDYYLVSFHLETVDLDWLKNQQVNAPIIVLSDGNHYNCNIPGVHFVSFVYWHRQLERIVDWFGIKRKSVPAYKFSAVCNRITQSKIWITTKLLESARDASQIKLATWLELKNVHEWQLTGNTVLDDLTTTFIEKYQGQEITVDDFDNQQHNVQNITANPWQPLLQNSAVNFTNESFHYSRMKKDGKIYTWPGPFITEKTLKCLVGQTAFIPVGQFDTYHTLQKFGFQFDYGFDISWDLDPGNLTRAQRIVDLIDDLNERSAEELYSMTRDSSQFNQNYIIGGDFSKFCKEHNKQAIEQVFEIII